MSLFKRIDQLISEGGALYIYIYIRYRIYIYTYSCVSQVIGATPFPPVRCPLLPRLSPGWSSVTATPCRREWRGATRILLAALYSGYLKNEAHHECQGCIYVIIHIYIYVCMYNYILYNYIYVIWLYTVALLKSIYNYAYTVHSSWLLWLKAIYCTS